MSDILDLAIVYRILRLLTTPFEEWKLYKEGIINDKGEVIKQNADVSYFDSLVLNLKRLINKIPGGKSKIGSYAVALTLLKNASAISEGSQEFLIQLPVIFEECLLEAQQTLNEDGVPANNVGGGAIASVGIGPQGEPGLIPKWRKKYKEENAAEVKNTVLPVVQKIRRIMGIVP